MIGRTLRITMWQPWNGAALGERVWAVLMYLQSAIPAASGIVPRSTGHCRTLEARRLALK